MHLKLNVELYEELVTEKMFSVKEVSCKSWQRRERREGSIPEGQVIPWWQWYHKGSGTVVAVVPW